YSLVAVAAACGLSSSPTRRSSDLQLMQDGVASIPHAASRDQTVAVIEVPADASSNPNWSGLTVDIKEPIVYLTGSRARRAPSDPDRKSTRLNSSHVKISYAVVCLK